MKLSTRPVKQWSADKNSHRSATVMLHPSIHHNIHRVDTRMEININEPRPELLLNDFIPAKCFIGPVHRCLLSALWAEEPHHTAEVWLSHILAQQIEVILSLRPWHTKRNNRSISQRRDLIPIYISKQQSKTFLLIGHMWLLCLWKHNHKWSTQQTSNGVFSQSGTTIRRLHFRTVQTIWYHP